jgi:acrylyl-CoA reductase (NADPH)/3-hydroxypropionyl-CoA dehydratase/3-hydroxypropionyl-CoA synthetase
MMQIKTTESTKAVLRPPRSNPILTREDWERQRKAFLADPGKFHGDIARSAIHWYDEALNAWITWDEEAKRWTGLNADSGAAVDVSHGADYAPWKRAFNDDNPPFYHWFEGGLTNACFNEVDRWVMLGHGDEVAYYFEGDRWDSSLNNGRGGPVVSYPVSRKKMLLEVVKAAQVLLDLGLKQGDRIALNMPNIMEQIYYTEAAKRLGIIYTAVFGGFSDKTLSDRIHNAGARIVITSDGGYRNAQVGDFKEVYTDPALDKFVPIEVALQLVHDTLDKLSSTLTAEQKELLVNRVNEAIFSEITVERSDVMRGVGRALDEMSSLDAATQSHVRTSIAQALVESPPRVDTVIVVRHTGHEILWRPERDQWSHDLMKPAVEKILANANAAGVNVSSESDLLSLPDAEFVKAMYATSKCEPVDAEFPMFIIYTSGSTGKPKGVVHVHGGYTAGLAYTMRVSFDAEPGDTIFVVADPGWITGQSYLISATLAARCTGIVAEGSPIFPSAGRFSSIIERYNVNIFKAGVTFLKAIMTDPQNTADVQQYSMDTLRVSTFCAEPVNPAVQQFGMDLMTPQYINSYWATEHGGIVWTHFYGNDDYPLRPDAHTYPLPWVMGDVWVTENAAEAEENGQATKIRQGGLEERGEIVIAYPPYPYLTRTIWGDTANFALEGRGVSPQWRGDAERFIKTYWKQGPNGQWGYVQGDFAMKYDDGSFSLHGRSDDVINVSGHRMGTEEIEGAILRDKQIVGDSPVGNCIVVGAPHREKGLTPVAFIVTVGGRKLSTEDRRRLTETVRNEKGQVSIPEDYIEVTAFPETRSGKYMRRYLRNMMLDEPLGDTTTLRNPEVLEELQQKIGTWKHRQRLSEEQRIFERYRYFRIEYHPVAKHAWMAIVTVSNPPVNALNERSLDELNTLLDHLARRDDVMAVVFTGDGTKSFVAGADIRQLLEEIHTIEDALAIPNNAHLAFRKIETMKKPCIAAINGVALGGGMEFAMACHYRIADQHAQFGQPEVNLRLLPGYGGTQRMPRLLFSRRGEEGLAKALMVIMGGRTVDAKRAYEIGLVDALATENQDVVTMAVEMVRQYAEHKTGEAPLVTTAPQTGYTLEQSDDPRTFFSLFPYPEANIGLWPELAEAFKQRQGLTAEWEQPQPEFVHEHLEPLMAKPIIERLLKQAKWAGREKTVNRIIDAIRFGYEKGLLKGLEHEAHVFAEAVVDPEGGKTGIQAFMDRQNAPLPTRRRILISDQEKQNLIEEGYLLPIGAPFFPGVTPVPVAQYAQAAVRDEETGAALHGDPMDVEKEIILPVEKPGPMDVQLYMLASEVNFNDIWAITGVPVSLFDDHDRDWHVTGSGGIGLIVAMGESVKHEGRLKVGDLVTIYSGQSDLLSPMQGLDPMAADFVIQGYQTPDASHQQFMLAQAPQCLPLPPDLTLEAAGSYILNLGTVYRALFTTLKVQGGGRIFIEGSATGTGLDATKSAARNNLFVTGMVSNTERAQVIKDAGATGYINRKDARYQGIFTRIPEEPEKWAEWESAGDVMLDDFRAQNGGHLADYALSHAGELSFPRSFQLLGEPHGGFIPTLAFYGASSGYHFTFMGKSGNADPEEMLTRAGLRAGEAVMLYYGLERYHQHGTRSSTQLMDGAGLEAIEAARVKGARIVVVTYTDAQREFIQSLGFGAALRGVVSIEELKRRFGDDFDWPKTMPALPDPKKDLELFKTKVREFNDLTFKPLGGAVGAYLRSADNPRGYPDLIIERAGHDVLSTSVTLIKPFTGRVVYFEDMGSQRYSFFAPQVWMRQRRIYMPSANIWGTHLSNAYEIVKLNDEISAGLLSVTDPLLVPWEELKEAHQAMWENRHTGATYVVNHALPRAGLKSKDELYEAWAESWLSSKG